ncbi:membrane protein, probable [Alloactinosynnema sp. L-07]|uniref:MFS transporter n=1 Tax=Alloactinosynnema sp. L-07 TaxID=1653480 RepID=UPI00065EF9D9|nr:MFS transporter [Alloactinosynnema sp. L-07]CRK59211.1 membrane protein, probable [Alloactinosynnema sp. L-07]
MFLDRWRRTESPSDDLDVLITEYEAGREDNRHTLTQHTTIILAAVTALGGILLLSDNVKMDDGIRVLLCGIALAISTYAAVYFASATARQLYMRAVEERIANLANTDLGGSLHGENDGPAPVIRLPAIGSIERAINSPRQRNRITVAHWFIYAVVLTVPAAVVLKLTLEIDNHYIERGILLFEMVYCPFISWVIWSTSSSPTRFFAKVLRWTEERGGAGAGATPRRALIRYLVWPRPADAIKATYYLVACGVGAAIYDPSTEALINALIFWVALEPLAYQARYAWNDLRDADHDQAHTQAKARGRIPWNKDDPEDPALRLVAIMVVARLGIAFAVVTLLVKGGSAVGWGLVFLLALLVHTFVYEAARVVTKRGTRAGRAAQALKKPKIPEHVVYLLVGLGYGLRATAGLWFGSGATERSPEVLASFFGFSTMLGIANVTMVWLFEGSTLATPAAVGKGSQKSHVTSLWNHYRYRSKLPAIAAEPNRERWLLDRDLIRSPWFIAHIAAGCAAVVLGGVLWHEIAKRGRIGSLPDHGEWFVAAGAVIWCLTGIVLARLPVNDGWLVGLGIPVVAVVALAPRLGPGVIIALAPIVLVIVVYLATRSGNYDTAVSGLGNLIARSRKMVRSIGLGILSWLLPGSVASAVVSERVSERLAEREEAERQLLESGRVPTKWLVQFALAGYGIWLAFSTPIALLLPGRLQAMLPDAWSVEHGWILAAGAMVAVIVNIMAGYWSDRTTGEFGRRRPFILVGSIGGSLAVAGIGFTANWWQILIAWCVAQAFLNAMLAGLLALMVDKLTRRQLAGAVTMFGAAQIIGPMLGGVVTLSLRPDSPFPWIIVGITAVVLTIPILIGADETPMSTAAPGRRPRLVAIFREHIFGNRNMGMAFTARLSFQAAFTVGVAYLPFYLLKTVGQKVGSFPSMVLSMAVTSFFVGAAALSFGPRAEKLPGSEVVILKRYVTRSGIVMAAGLMCLIAIAFVDSPSLRWVLIVGVAAVLGVGSGLFAPTDLHLNTKVLPDRNHHGAYLGVFNTASALPQVLVLVVALNAASTSGGHVAVFVIAAAFALISAVFVQFVRVDVTTTSTDDEVH